FFSSRRRHTRSKRDWSSDVCSSDLNLELMWLMRKLKPDFKTIADFRKGNTKGLKKIFQEFSEICRKLELFGGELVAVDGSKFREIGRASCREREEMWGGRGVG